MDGITQANVILTFVVSIITIIIPFSVLVSKHSKIEVKVDTIWDFLMRRAIAAGLENNVLSMNSPVVATAKGEAMLEPVKEDLLKFYQEVGAKLNVRDLFMELERKFGDRFMKDVCIPHGISQGACLLAAIDIMRKTAA